MSNGEGGLDLLIRNRFFRRAKRGVFVDVGAARPDYLSMSALFRASGWQVIAIEPNPDFCDLHRAAGCEVLQYACADFEADDVPFSIVDSEEWEYADGRVTYESYSSITVKEPFRAAVPPNLHIREIRVKVRRLDTILAAHAPKVRKIDILSIDVEGWELEVLAGVSLRRYRPKVVIVENYVDDPEYTEYMLERGYIFWDRVWLNDVYVRMRALSPFTAMSRFFATRKLIRERRAEKLRKSETPSEDSEGVS